MMQKTLDLLQHGLKQRMGEIVLSFSKTKKVGVYS